MGEFEWVALEETKPASGPNVFRCEGSECGRRQGGELGYVLCTVLGVGVVIFLPFSSFSFLIT